VAVTGLVASANQVRRVAAGGGLRLIHERTGCPQQSITLTEAGANASATDLAMANDSRTFLKCGRVVIEIV
jgi:hypothetical protein